MDWIKSFQEVVPWLTTLSVVPKAIVSLVIAGAAAFILAVIWTPPPETAIKEILHDCYKRALFTRMHAQTNLPAMFASINTCREVVQNKIPEIRQDRLQDIAVDLLATLEEIDGHAESGKEDFDEINKLKVAALRDFRRLAIATGNNFHLPNSGKLAIDKYFSAAEISAPVSEDDLKNQTDAADRR